MKLITLKAVLKDGIYWLRIGRKSTNLCLEEFKRAFDLADRKETIEAVELVVYSNPGPTRFQVKVSLYNDKCGVDCELTIYPSEGCPVYYELGVAATKAIARILGVSLRKQEVDHPIKKTVWIMPYIIYTPK